MIDSLIAPFRRKRAKKLYFAVAISDRPTEDFKFVPDADCKVFLVTGDVLPGDVIPRTSLKAMVERFEEVQQLDGNVVVSEKMQ